MARLRVVRHPLVDRDIARVATFLLQRTTPRSASRKLAALDADVNALGEDPYRGTVRIEIAPSLRAIPSAGRGVIAFEVRDDTHTVRVLSITWGGADWMGMIARRSRS